MMSIKAYQERMNALFPSIPKISPIWLWLSCLGHRCSTTEPMLVFSEKQGSTNQIHILAQFSKSVGVGSSLVMMSLVCAILVSCGAYNLLALPNNAALGVSILYLGLVVLYKPAGLTPQYVVRRYITPIVGSFNAESDHLCSLLRAFASTEGKRGSAAVACAIAKTTMTGDYIVSALLDAATLVKSGADIPPKIRDRAILELRFMDDLLLYGILLYTAWVSLALTVVGYAVFPNVPNYTRGILAAGQSATVFLLVVPWLHTTPSLRIFRNFAVFIKHYRPEDCMPE